MYIGSDSIFIYMFKSDVSPPEPVAPSTKVVAEQQPSQDLGVDCGGILCAACRLLMHG